MKAETQILGVQFISFIMGALTLRLAMLISGKGFFWLVVELASCGLGFALTILLVEIFLFHSLQK